MNPEQQTTATTATTAAASLATEPIADTKVLCHTRRCNGRDVCSCILRVESAYFHKNLAEKAAAKKRRVDDRSVTFKGVTRRYQKVTNIQKLSFELKLHITLFLPPRALGRLGMVRLASEA